MHPLKEKVYNYLLLIPKGKVVTYKQIATAIGNPGLARVVGNILHENPDENKWVKISTGTGTKGEKVFEWQYTEVNCGMKNHKKYLIFRRNLSEKNKIRGYIAYGTNETKIEEFVKTAGIRWTIEMNFAEMKGETGLDQYEVRSYEGLQKHITLSCIAHAFLTVLREQFCHLPEMSAEYENTMEEFKKKRKSESLSAKQKSDIL